MNIQERLEIFFRRLESASPAGSAEEAMALVCRLIEEIEDEFCLLPREEPPPGQRFTGRMYAPQKDMIKPWLSGGLMATTRRHLIYCAANGRIVVEHRFTRVTITAKDGKTR